MIRLVGPGGAGKTTVGVVLAELLGGAFLDLDQEFTSRHGDIDEAISSEGYEAYARRNVETYLAVDRSAFAGVLALSSGFMTYPPHVHRRYVEIREEIARSPTTFVLLRSFELEACVVATVRRQLARPFANRTAEREEPVIRGRHGIYLALPAGKVETMSSPDAVAAEIRSKLRLSDDAGDRGQESSLLLGKTGESRLGLLDA